MLTLTQNPTPHCCHPPAGGLGHTGGGNSKALRKCPRPGRGESKGTASRRDASGTAHDRPCSRDLAPCPPAPHAGLRGSDSQRRPCLRAFAHAPLLSCHFLQEASLVPLGQTLPDALPKSASLSCPRLSLNRLLLHVLGSPLITGQTIRPEGPQGSAYHHGNRRPRPASATLRAQQTRGR